jgi:hypothetical protein
MEPPRCETCPYFHKLIEPPPNATPHEIEEDYPDGACHRFPPKAFGKPVYDWDRPLSGFFPEVCWLDWCGEHPDFPAYLASRVEHRRRPDDDRGVGEPVEVQV